MWTVLIFLSTHMDKFASKDEQDIKGQDFDVEEAIKMIFGVTIPFITRFLRTENTAEKRSFTAGACASCPGSDSCA